VNHLYARYKNSIEPSDRSTTAQLQKFVDGLNGEELQELQNITLKPEEERRLLQQQSENISTFLAGHEEYLDCDANSAIMKQVLAGILRERNRRYATHQDLEDAYNEMLSRGWATLNAKVVDEKKSAAIQQRAIEHREAVTFNPDRADTMSMEQLRKAADSQLSARGR
jgi:hypothetical protein